MNSFSAIDRQKLIQQLQENTFDVLVIGCGITGCGIALDAVSRGLTVAVIDMQDVAGGTSSRSTRLIHGGLRYLKQFEFKLVSEVAQEREIIFKNAPHLVRPEPILLPITKTGSLGKFTTRLAMWVYETLARVKKEERHTFLSAAQTLHLEPSLKSEGLLGGILYYEYRTNDARLTLSVLKEAVERGAMALTYLKVNGFKYTDGKIAGIKATDELQHNKLEVKARYIINAAGPWVDELDRLDKQSQGGKLQPTKGVHLVFAHDKLPLRQAVYFDTNDRRMVFAIPHNNKTYVGTTDTFFEGDQLDPSVTMEDKNYLIKNINGYFASPKLLLTDVESSWAGIRPLIKKAGKNPSEISRKDELFEWPSGLISIAGGKLSGYRKMAERAVDVVAKKIKESNGKPILSCITRKVAVFGGNFDAEFIKKTELLAERVGLKKEETEQLVFRYGSETNKFITLIEKTKRDDQAVHGLPASIFAELSYAIQEEMCVKPADFFIRRTAMLYFDKPSVHRYKAGVIACMSEILGWDDERTLLETKDLDRLINLAG